jgi:hypothetical protein
MLRKLKKPRKRGQEEKTDDGEQGAENFFTRRRVSFLISHLLVYK